jgi:hypothetical protein
VARVKGHIKNVQVRNNPRMSVQNKNNGVRMQLTYSELKPEDIKPGKFDYHAVAIGVFIVAMLLLGVALAL